MQQYFIDYEIIDESNIILRDDIIYHLKTVLRNTNKNFRIVDSKGKVFLCSLDGNMAKINSILNENNELNVDVTCIMALVRSEKFELTLQKLAELGVKRIVPYNAYRSVVKEKKQDKKLERYKRILTEASEQCHRNFIPEITPAINLNEIKNYLSDLNLLAYEKEHNVNINDLKNKSITYIIGPEGGFEKEEIDELLKLGFKSITLGKRILRAETAAIYLQSIIAEANQ